LPPRWKCTRHEDRLSELKQAGGVGYCNITSAAKSPEDCDH
jgi:hypothetical protein